MLRTCSVVAFVTLLAPLAQAATFTVSPGGKIGDAVAQAKAGDTVLLEPGTYAENLSLSASGTSGQPITLSGAGAVLQGTIKLPGDHWLIDGLTIESPAGVDTIGISGSFNVLKGIEISGGTKDGIDGGGTGNQVLDSLIHHMDGGSADAHCIVLNPGATDWLISGNKLYDCSGDGVQLYSSGPERSIKGVEISGNEIYYTGAIGRMENAVDVKNADGLLIADNRMYGFSMNKTVVFQKGPANVEVRCNVMFDGFTGVEFRAEDGGKMEQVRFVRNLMYGFSSYALKFDDVYEGKVYNNTFVDVANDGLRIEGGGLHSGDVKNNLWVDTGAVEASGASADYNGFFNSKNLLAGTHDVTSDPLLDAQHAPGPGSPVIDAGTNVGLPFSGSAPDIGYFETGGDDPCVAPASSGGNAGTGGVPGSGGGTAGDAGSSGSGTGAAGAGGSGASAGAAGSSADPAGDEGGCGCRLASSPIGPSSAWLGLGLLGFALRRRSGSYLRGRGRS